ncbi:hypothetical protein IW262DRAFT_1453589 [Armillaria fumosa]|nr:hypothetical protein IW262DRAFT_1453589 [Armillaria fumosa]
MVKGKKGTAALTPWQTIQNDSILSNLKTAQPDEVEWLTGVVKKHDITFLRNTLVPQFRNQRYGKKFWFPFIETLNREKSTISTLEAAEVITCKPYDFRDVPRRYACYTEAKFSGDLAVIAQLVHLCVDIIEQRTDIFDRMKSGKEREVWKFYEALVPDMTKVVETNFDLRPLFKSFFENAVCVIIDQKRDVSESMALTLLQASHEFLTRFLTREQFEFLAKESIQPARSLARCLHGRVLPTLSDAAAQDAVSAIVAQSIDQADRDHCASKRSYYHSLSCPSFRLIDLLDFTYDVGVRDSLSTDVLNELIAKDDKDDESITNQLVPLFTGLPPPHPSPEW